jgi:hypothetical protein
VLDPAILARLDVLVTEGTSIGDGWGLGCEALLHLCVGVELPCWNGLLALGTSLIVFVLLALAEQVVI